MVWTATFAASTQNVRSRPNSPISIATLNGGFHPKTELRVRYQAFAS
jgi:hypothetical protein